MNTAVTVIDRTVGAARSPAVPDLILPALVGEQTTWAASAAPNKVLRAGRRAGKTRFAYVAGLTGHGPGWDADAPRFPGVLQGTRARPHDVVWISPTYSNLSTVLWREEIEPRMAHLPFVVLNKTLHDVMIPGVGSLLLRSGDRSAIDSVRGVGKRLAGVIVDEAAHMDLRGALLDVILPACLDNGAWLLLMSTTNASSDGGYDDTGAPQVPSYFNVICEEIRAGRRPPHLWQEFHATAYDNPELDHVAVDALVAEYPADSPQLEQEVFAKLLRAGVGLALPHLSAAHHLVPPFIVPAHWTRFGAFDWGYNHPWSFGEYAVDGDGRVYGVRTLTGREDLPATICDTILSSVRSARELLIYAGRDIFQHKGQAVGYDGPTIAETFYAHGLRVTPGDDTRIAGLSNFREYTAIPPAKLDPVTGQTVQPRPRFVWFDTADNRVGFAQCAAMQLDPKRAEDALKIDADRAGRGGDDHYDQTRMALMSRPRASRNPATDARDVSGIGRSAGVDYEHQRPRSKLSGDEEADRILGAAVGDPLARRYAVPMRRR